MESQQSPADYVVTSLLRTFWDESKKLIDTQMSKNLDDFDVESIIAGTDSHLLMNSVSALGKIGQPFLSMIVASLINWKATYACPTPPSSSQLRIRQTFSERFELCKEYIFLTALNTILARTDGGALKEALCTNLLSLGTTFAAKRATLGTARTKAFAAIFKQYRVLLGELSTRNFAIVSRCFTAAVDKGEYSVFSKMKFERENPLLMEQFVKQFLFIYFSPKSKLKDKSKRIKLMEFFFTLLRNFVMHIAPLQYEFQYDEVTNKIVRSLKDDSKELHLAIVLCFSNFSEHYRNRYINEDLAEKLVKYSKKKPSFFSSVLPIIPPLGEKAKELATKAAEREIPPEPSKYNPIDWGKEKKPSKEELNKEVKKRCKALCLFLLRYGNDAHLCDLVPDELPFHELVNLMLNDKLGTREKALVKSDTILSLLYRFNKNRICFIIAALAIEAKRREPQQLQAHDELDIKTFCEATRPPFWCAQVFEKILSISESRKKEEAKIKKDKSNDKQISLTKDSCNENKQPSVKEQSKLKEKKHSKNKSRDQNQENKKEKRKEKRELTKTKDQEQCLNLFGRYTNAVSDFVVKLIEKKPELLTAPTIDSTQELLIFSVISLLPFICTEDIEKDAIHILYSILVNPNRASFYHTAYDSMNKLFYKHPDNVLSCIISEFESNYLSKALLEEESVKLSAEFVALFHFYTTINDLNTEDIITSTKKGEAVSFFFMCSPFAKVRKEGYKLLQYCDSLSTQRLHGKLSLLEQMNERFEDTLHRSLKSLHYFDFAVSQKTQEIYSLMNFEGFLMSAETIPKIYPIILAEVARTVAECDDNGYLFHVGEKLREYVYHFSEVERQRIAQRKATIATGRALVTAPKKEDKKRSNLYLLSWANACLVGSVFLSEGESILRKEEASSSKEDVAQLKQINEELERRQALRFQSHFTHLLPYITNNKAEKHSSMCYAMRAFAISGSGPRVLSVLSAIEKKIKNEEVGKSVTSMILVYCCRDKTNHGRIATAFHEKLMGKLRELYTYLHDSKTIYDQKFTARYCFAVAVGDLCKAFCRSYSLIPDDAVTLEDTYKFKMLLERWSTVREKFVQAQRRVDASLVHWLADRSAAQSRARLEYAVNAFERFSARAIAGLSTRGTVDTASLPDFVNRFYTFAESYLPKNEHVAVRIFVNVFRLASYSSSLLLSFIERLYATGLVAGRMRALAQVGEHLAAPLVLPSALTLCIFCADKESEIKECVNEIVAAISAASVSLYSMQPFSIDPLPVHCILNETVQQAQILLSRQLADHFKFASVEVFLELEQRVRSLHLMTTSRDRITDKEKQPVTANGNTVAGNDVNTQKEIDTLLRAMTQWVGYLPPQNQQISQAALYALFLLTNSFRQDHLHAVKKIWAKFFSSNANIVRFVNFVYNFRTFLQTKEFYSVCLNIIMFNKNTAVSLLVDSIVKKIKQSHKIKFVLLTPGDKSDPIETKLFSQFEEKQARFVKAFSRTDLSVSIPFPYDLISLVAELLKVYPKGVGSNQLYLLILGFCGIANEIKKRNFIKEAEKMPFNAIKSSITMIKAILRSVDRPNTNIAIALDGIEDLLEQEITAAEANTILEGLGHLFAQSIDVLQPNDDALAEAVGQCLSIAEYAKNPNIHSLALVMLRGLINEISPELVCAVTLIGYKVRSLLPDALLTLCSFVAHCDDSEVSGTAQVFWTAVIALRSPDVRTVKSGLLLLRLYFLRILDRPDHDKILAELSKNQPSFLGDFNGILPAVCTHLKNQETEQDALEALFLLSGMLGFHIVGTNTNENAVAFFLYTLPLILETIKDETGCAAWFNREPPASTPQKFQNEYRELLTLADELTTVHENMDNHNMTLSQRLVYHLRNASATLGYSELNGILNDATNFKSNTVFSNAVAGCLAKAVHTCPKFAVRCLSDALQSCMRFQYHLLTLCVSLIGRMSAADFFSLTDPAPLFKPLLAVIEGKITTSQHLILWNMALKTLNWSVAFSSLNYNSIEQIFNPVTSGLQAKLPSALSSLPSLLTAGTPDPTFSCLKLLIQSMLQECSFDLSNHVQVILDDFPFLYLCGASTPAKIKRRSFSCLEAPTESSEREKPKPIIPKADLSKKLRAVDAPELEGGDFAPPEDLDEQDFEENQEMEEETEDEANINKEKSSQPFKEEEQNNSKSNSAQATLPIINRGQISDDPVAKNPNANPHVCTDEIESDNSFEGEKEDDEENNTRECEPLCSNGEARNSTEEEYQSLESPDLILDETFGEPSTAKKDMNIDEADFKESRQNDHDPRTLSESQQHSEDESLDEHKSNVQTSVQPQLNDDARQYSPAQPTEEDIEENGGTSEDKHERISTISSNNLSSETPQASEDSLNEANIADLIQAFSLCANIFTKAKVLYEQAFQESKLRAPQLLPTHIEQISKKSMEKMRMTVYKDIEFANPNITSQEQVTFIDDALELVNKLEEAYGDFVTLKEEAETKSKSVKVPERIAAFTEAFQMLLYIYQICVAFQRLVSETFNIGDLFGCKSQEDAICKQFKALK